MGEDNWLIIDTDAGVDDAVAISMAVKLGKVYGARLRLLMTCHGNTSEENVHINCVKTLHACGSANEIQIARGATAPAVASAIDASYFHGIDGLGDVDNTAIAFTEDNANTHDATAVDKGYSEQLDSEATANTTGITLITLGPLTNLAGLLNLTQDIRLEPAMRECIKRWINLIDNLVIMGGSCNGLGNVTRTAEFNIHADCEAAEAVFKYYHLEENGSTQVTVVSWDLCKDAAVPWGLYDDLMQNHNQDIAAFLRSICYYSFYTNREPENKRGNNGAVICDALAVAVGLALQKGDDESIITAYSNVHVEVECTGKITRGQTVCDFGHCYDGINRRRSVRWVTDVNLERYVNMFQTLFVE
eukprot:GSChrysophyteH1.ASY1.ANO1.3001.1 assembled CDS